MVFLGEEIHLVHRVTQVIQIIRNLLDFFSSRLHSHSLPLAHVSASCLAAPPSSPPLPLLFVVNVSTLTNVTYFKTMIFYYFRLFTSAMCTTSSSASSSVISGGMLASVSSARLFSSELDLLSDASMRRKNQTESYFWELKNNKTKESSTVWVGGPISKHFIVLKSKK